MNNRNFFQPMLSAAVLSLAIGFPCVSVGRAQVPNDGYPATKPPVPVSPVVAPATAVPAKHTTSYTVSAGDSLTTIAKKFNTTRKKLRALNDLTASTVKPGQVLLVPALPVAKSSKARFHSTYLAAQPVQDFDVPASTFASCPVPLPTPGDDPQVTAPASGTEEKPAPIAKLVSPAEMAAETAPEVEILTPATPQPAPVISKVTPLPVASAPTVSSKSMTRPTPTFSTGASTASVRPFPAAAPYNPPAPRLSSSGPSAGAVPSLNSNSGAMQIASANDWGGRFLQQARALGNEGIEYNEDWRPPGEARSWPMDCSNTSRYLYKVTAGLNLPRTASDQYYYLHLQGKAWDVPLNARGFVDTDFLREHLKPGDLLFWENTYRPERQPPITHVMVYLGTNERGQWMMAGSQSSHGGEHNRRNGGPDIYVFRPSQPCGGYTTWMGLVRHQGRFCAFGRPLEADPSKLAVAADE